MVVAGRVERLSVEDSAVLFAERPLTARATTAVSEQSSELADLRSLRERATGLVEGGEAIARPADWWGYLLVPQRIEFWYGSPDRLHQRLHYERDEGGGWTWARLQP
jgi:pyridoxamine 5'-phosphate oxidase